MFDSCASMVGKYKGTATQTAIKKICFGVVQILVCRRAIVVLASAVRIQKLERYRED